MNFKAIKSYWNYDAYQRIKRVKALQKNKLYGNAINKKNPNSYQEYLNKISGFNCCCKQPTCDGCCSYSLDGCCKNGTTQTYVSSTECLCFKGTMETSKNSQPPADLQPDTPGFGTGYSDISGISGEAGATVPYTPFGSLSPKETCESLTINSITSAPIVPGTTQFALQITFSGPAWGGVFFTCVTLTNGNEKIVVYMKDATSQIWTLNGVTYYTYVWTVSSGLTEGSAWCVEMKI